MGTQLRPFLFLHVREIGSGTFNAFGGHAEVFGANPPENTVLFDISGSKVEKNTFREIGSGSFSAIVGSV